MIRRKWGSPDALPPLEETFDLPLLEATGFRVPVVVSDWRLAPGGEGDRVNVGPEICGRSAVVVGPILRWLSKFRVRLLSRSRRSDTDSAVDAGGRGDAVPGVALAFVGGLVPDEPAFHNPAFNRAGQMFQRELLLGLKHAKLAPSTVVSVRPIPSFSRSRRVWIGRGVTYLPEGIAINLLPFVNITPIKQITIGVGTLWELLRWGWRTRHMLYRVIYTYNLSVPPGLFTWLAARLIGAKAMASLNDINEPGQTVPRTFFWRLDFWLHRRLIPRFDSLVVVTDRIIDDFAPRTPHIRVEGGIKQEILDRMCDAFRPAKAPNAPFVIATAGTLNEANGVLALLEAFSLLKEEGYRLRIAGNGPLEHKVRESAEKDPQIEYYEFVPFDKVLELYKTADVLINMRLTKGLNTKYFFPSKMMEYLASGTPVITTCTGHVEEEFAEIAYLLKDESPRGLAEMIRHVASIDPQVRWEMGQKARSYMAANKTWEAQGRRLAQFIRETAMGKAEPKLSKSNEV